MANKGRVFSGARPTGRQHLGNYLGAIRNYVALQKDYDCIYCIVDLHALTTLDTTQNLKENTCKMALDWLAAGIDRRKRSCLCSQRPKLPATHPLDGHPAGKTDRPSDF
jgi:tryptophanyl-tRNA synthetase